VRDTCGLQLDCYAIETLDQLSKFQNALSLVGKIEREMEINHGRVFAQTINHVRWNFPLAGNLECLWNLGVAGAKLDGHMVFGLDIGEHHTREHVSAFRFVGDDLTEKVVPVGPRSRNADDQFRRHGAERSAMLNTRDG
jgi:hypothetical protein